MAAATYRCGPLAVHVEAEGPAAHRIDQALALFDLDWDPPHRQVDLVVGAVAGPPRPAGGTYLRCQRLLADATPGGLYASTPSGPAATGALGAGHDRWTVEVPAARAGAGDLDDLEEITTLALTVGWRRAGWVPVHAAGVVSPAGACALVCAPSDGGKSTLTAAMVGRGWQALGDDKVLLRLDGDDAPEAAALLHTFNLHPGTRRWLPEVGDLERLPVYSAWTEKRRVSLTTIWPGAAARRGSPTRLVALERADAPASVRARPMARGAVLDTLLRQTVVPADRAEARSILSVVAATARRLDGIHLSVGPEAWGDPAVLDAVERVVG